MALDDTIAEAEAFAAAAKRGNGAAPADTAPSEPPADQTTGAPDGRGFGSMLLGLVPGFGPKGFGPQNWAPAPYNAADAAVHGATFGLSDIARGAAGDLYGGPSITDVKADRDTFATEHPLANIGANVAGGAGTAAALPLGSAFAPAAKIAEPVLRYGAQALTGAGIGAGIGGAQGAIDAAPAGTDAALQGARQGAFWGGTVGAAAPFVGAGVGRVAQRVGDWWAARPALNELGVGQPALDAVRRGLTSDDAFAGGQGAQNIARAGPYGMAADAGPTTTGMLDEAISSGGPGALTARNAVNQRAADASQTLSSALDAALGPPQGISTTRAGIRTASAPFRSAAYDTAYSQPIDYSTPAGQQLTELLSRTPQRAVAHANEMMVGQGQAPGRMVTTVNPDGTLSFATPPTVRQIDYLTRGLRQISTEAEGALGGSTEASSTWQGLSGDIRRTLGGPRGNRGAGMVPEYGQALDTAADPISQSQAVQFGGDLLKKNLPRDVVAERVGHMSQAELAATRQGIRSHIDEVVANVNNAVSNPSYDAAQVMTPLRSLNSQAVREKLAMVLDPVQMASLERQLEIATSGAQLAANTSRNSATAGRLATREAISQATEPGLVGQALEGHPINAAQRLLQAFTGRTPQDKLAAMDAVRGQISDLLTRQRDPQTGRSVADVIEGILPGLMRSNNASQAIGAIPGIMLPAEVQGVRQFMQPGPGGPVPRGVFRPGQEGSGGGNPPPENPYAGEDEQSRPFAANGASEATAAPPAAPQQYTVPGSAPRDLSPVPDTGEGTWWKNAVGAAGDIGTATAGLAERFNKGAANMLGLRSPGSDIYRADIPVAEGLGRAGDVATFLTGGLANSLFPAPGALSAAAGYTPTAARSAARTAEELLADTQGSVPRRPTPVPEGVRAPGVAPEAPVPPGTLPPEGAPKAAAEAPVPVGIRAYHGSPHDFPAEPGYPLGRFRDDRIGTGEGAQAYGHGLYFAENEPVAESYLKTPDWRYGGKKAQTIYDRLSDERGLDNAGWDKLNAQRGFWEKVVLGRSPRSIIDDARANPDQFGPSELAYIQSLDPNKFKRAGGHMYEVNLKAPPEHFLDWDKPLSEQSPYIRDRITGRTDWTTPDMQGARLYGEMINRASRDPIAAAQQLKNMGIPGIRYLDQGSRGAGEGSRNYVVFDPATIAMVRKYGLAALIAGGGALGLGGAAQARSLPGETGR